MTIYIFYGSQLYLGENWRAKSVIFSFFSSIFQVSKNCPPNIKIVCDKVSQIFTNKMYEMTIY